MSSYKIPRMDSVESLHSYLKEAVYLLNSGDKNIPSCPGCVDCDSLDCADCILNEITINNLYIKFLTRFGCAQDASGKWRVPDKLTNVGMVVPKRVVCDDPICPDGPCTVLLPYEKSIDSTVCVQGKCGVIPNWHSGTVGLDEVSAEDEDDEDDEERSEAVGAMSIAEFLAKFDEDTDNETIVAEVAKQYTAEELAKFVVCDLWADGNSVQQIIAAYNR